MILYEHEQTGGTDAVDATVAASGVEAKTQAPVSGSGLMSTPLAGSTVKETVNRSPIAMPVPVLVVSTTVPLT